MKVGLLTSYRAQKVYSKQYMAIINHLQKRGHQVVHSMETTVDQLLPLIYADREKIFNDFYKKLEECDVIFVECSMQSTQVGYGFAQLHAKGKPLVQMTLRGVFQSFSPKGEIYSNLENIMAVEYDESDVAEVIDDALSYMSGHLDKRFTIIFPAHLMSELEEVAHKHKVPKAVYIRQLIEKSLLENSSNK
jgi:hypothetical protein